MNTSFKNSAVMAAVVVSPVPGQSPRHHTAGDLNYPFVRRAFR